LILVLSVVNRKKLLERWHTQAPISTCLHSRRGR